MNVQIDGTGVRDSRPNTEQHLEFDEYGGRPEKRMNIKEEVVQIFTK